MTFLACYSDSKPLPENSLKWCQSVPGSPNWAGSWVLLLISVNKKAKIPNYGLTNFRMTTNDIFGMLFRPRTIAWKQSQVVPVGARVPKLSCKLDTFTNNSQWGDLKFNEKAKIPNFDLKKYANDSEWHRMTFSAYYSDSKLVPNTSPLLCKVVQSPLNLAGSWVLLYNNSI